MTLSVVAERAEAQCWIDSSTCTSSYCNIDCPTTANYIVFGKICYFTSCWWGVCQFGINSYYQKGSFVTTATTGTVSGDYRVFADGGSASGGNDLVRLANPAGEPCGSYTTVYGVLPNGNTTYMFWGDGGNDRIHLGYAAGDPPSQTCGSQVAPVNFGRADGRAGDDRIVGTGHGEELWGQDGEDTIWACSGPDAVHGGNHHDTLYGHKGPDVVHGDGGPDSLFGDDFGPEYDLSYDIVYGGEGDDDIGDDHGPGEYYGDIGCDIINSTRDYATACDCGPDLTYSGRVATTECTTITNCTQDCRPFGAEGASCPGATADERPDDSAVGDASAGGADGGSCNGDPDAGSCATEENQW